MSTIVLGEVGSGDLNIIGEAVGIFKSIDRHFQYDFSQNPSALKLGVRMALQYYAVMLFFGLVASILRVSLGALFLGILVPAILATLAGHAYAEQKRAIMPKGERVSWGFYAATFINILPTLVVLLAALADGTTDALPLLFIVFLNFIIIWGQVVNFTRSACKRGLKQLALQAEIAKRGGMTFRERFAFMARKSPE